MDYFTDEEEVKPKESTITFLKVFARRFRIEEAQ